MPTAATRPCTDLSKPRSIAWLRERLAKRNAQLTDLHGVATDALAALRAFHEWPNMDNQKALRITEARLSATLRATPAPQ